MIHLEPLEDQDFEAIARWNEGKPKDFIVQWAGPQYEHPLTAGFLKSCHAGHNGPGASEHIYRVMLGDEMIGTVMLLKFDPADNSAFVGRFLIGSPAHRGRGYGEQALREIVKLGFEDFKLAAVKLGVFDFNLGAIRCYEKVGFETYEFLPDAWQSESGPWGLYRMKITSYQWKAAEGCQ